MEKMGKQWSMDGQSTDRQTDRPTDKQHKNLVRVHKNELVLIFNRPLNGPTIHPWT